MERKNVKWLTVIGMLILLTAGSKISRTDSYSKAIKPPPPQPTVKPPAPILSIKSLDQKVDEKIIPLLLKSYGNAGSLLERGVGGPEGTRRPNGEFTQAYYGHQDPMCNYNWSASCSKGITNLGSFSYQQAADKPRALTPLQADRIQTQILRLQALELFHQAKRQHLHLNLFQLLSGIDLANQSPLAACVQQPDKAVVYKLAAGIDPNGSNTAKVTATFAKNNCSWGYIDRLAQAQRQKKLQGFDAVVYARQWSYFNVDPTSGRFNNWDAGGLGNNPVIIKADQLRRTLAVVSAMRYQVENFK